MAFFKFGGGAQQAIGDVFVIVAALTKALFETLHRGRQNQKHDRVGALLQYLLRSLHFDLQEHIGAVRSVRQRGAVEVAVKLRPLEKLAVVNGALEGGPIDKVILVTRLAGALRSGRPTLAEPESLVGFDDASGERSLANPAGSNKDEN